MARTSSAPAATEPPNDIVLSIRGLDKRYSSGFHALRGVDLDIRRGEIFALLGPNGAGKTTLIGSVCGLVRPTGGAVYVDGYDIQKDYRQTRERIGLVPQELATDMFETVWDTVCFSRGLFGKPPAPAYLDELLTQLSLREKKSSKIMTLSGGMKRRVLIAKALAHEPTLLFLDEPTAGVDVELRRDMWRLVQKLRERGVTIILTTHYIEEAEEMADRIGVIRSGELVLVEDKALLMRRLGKKELHLELAQPLPELPEELRSPRLGLAEGGARLVYTFDSQSDDNGIRALLDRLARHGIEFRDLKTIESSLEQIFVDLVGGPS